MSGPYAFPTHPDLQGHSLFVGMTLRDWFAGQALAEICRPDDDFDPAETAADCYIIADAMMAERAKRDAGS